MQLALALNAYCNARGFFDIHVCMCSLDTEGAKDAIPHAVLFLKPACRHSTRSVLEATIPVVPQPVSRY